MLYNDRNKCGCIKTKKLHIHHNFVYWFKIGTNSTYCSKISRYQLSKVEANVASSDGSGYVAEE